MAVVLVDEVEYWVDGAFIRIRITSGTETREHAVLGETFRRNHLRAKEALAIYDSQRGQLLPFAKPRRKRAQAV